MIDVDFTQLPFSLLDEEHRHRLENAMEMAYFEAGTVIIEARHPAQFVYLVHKGAVLELDPTLPAEAGRLGVYSAGDLFGALSVLNGRSRYRFITEEETLCYLIPADLFQSLCQDQKEFDDYFRQRLASKNQLLAERREGGVTMAGFMLAKVHQCMRQPLILDSGGTIAQAVAALNEHNADSLLMERDGHVGVITKTDLLRGLVNDGLTPESRALALASFELVTVPPDQVITVIADHLLPWPLPTSATDIEVRIIWEFRLPRALLGFVVGAALAVAGAVLQAVVRNPLADPFVFGVSSGASVAAVATLTLATGILAAVSVPVAAFAGALATTLTVFVLAQQRGRVTPNRLVLAGVAMSYLLSSITSYLVLRASSPGEGVTSVLSWLSGSLAAAEWGDLGLPSAVLVVTVAVLVLLARVLNAFLVGDETAASLGIDVGRVRLVLFVITSLLVGVVVAVSGAIGFVGLVVPHALRMIVGSDHRWLLPASALAGGLLLVVVDIVARTILAPTELPVGLLTAAIGAPFFLWLLRRSGRSAT